MDLSPFLITVASVGTLGGLLAGLRYTLLYSAVKRRPLSAEQRTSVEADVGSLEPGPLRSELARRLRAEDHPGRVRGLAAACFAVSAAAFVLLGILAGCPVP